MIDDIYIYIYSPYDSIDFTYLWMIFMGFHVGMSYAAMPYLPWIPWDSIFTDFRLEDLDPELFQAPSEKSGSEKPQPAAPGGLWTWWMIEILSRK